MKKKILITGGSGLLAVNWGFLVKENYTVILGLHNRKVSMDDTATVILDTTTVEKLSEQISAIAPDIVIHTAGLTNVEACENDPEAAYAVNVQLAGDIAAITASLGSQLVHISTDHLFMGETPNADELMLPAPVNEYGKTKLAAEKLVMANDPAALIVRTNFYGWGPAYRASFSDTIINALRSGKEISLFTDVFFTPILIQTLVAVVHELIDKKASGIFHVVGDERISKFEFGVLIAREFGLDPTRIRPIHFSDKAGLIKRPLDLSISNKKLRDTLGRNIGDVASQLKILHSQERNSYIYPLKLL